MSDPCFIPFKRTIGKSELPGAFTFPFYYQPHPLCLEAADELQQYLEHQQEWVHNFGLDAALEGNAIGKMFGVLVVENTCNEVGYLCAFSGKLAGSNTHSRFVPPIFDMLQPAGFFLKGENELNTINRRIESIEQGAALNAAISSMETEEQRTAAALLSLKEDIRHNKEKRRSLRAAKKTFLTEEEYEDLCSSLSKESISEQYQLKKAIREGKERTLHHQSLVDTFLNEVNALKAIRKEQSALLQEQLFAQYNFLNSKGATRNVKEIFIHTPLDNPPSGAGECATPKMLQYAYRNKLKPIAMAEFWWGQSPVSEIRKHKQFYPACRSKCEPILNYMLEGISVEPNPMLVQEDLGHSISTVYEDEYIIVVNKPAEFLSVPGKNITDSVWTLLRERYPHATGPLLVHRLDMSTSGLLIAAKTKEIHQHIQSQFIKKTISKRYVALLDGVLDQNKGTIELPLRVDLDNRPHQLVCYEYGKMAKTIWETIAVKDNTTRVHLYPVTGRTHQLRVHAAHPLGLNTPIVGDDLYGTRADRLCLHAEYLEIRHPITKKNISFQADAPF